MARQHQIILDDDGLRVVAACVGMGMCAWADKDDRAAQLMDYIIDKLNRQPEIILQLTEQFTAKRLDT